MESIKSLNSSQLRKICKQYKIPINGAKNKKVLLGRILIRKQMFKPDLPNEIFEQIFLYSLYYDVLNFKASCKSFYDMIDDNFWQKKIKIEFNIDYKLSDSKYEYLRLIKKTDDLRKIYYFEIYWKKYQNCMCKKCMQCRDLCW